MNKLIIAAILWLTFTTSYSQVYGTAGTLSEGKFNLGVIPTFLNNYGNNELMLFIQGGYGLTQNIDFGLKLGFLGDDSFFGTDVEYKIGKNFSLTGGAHSFYDKIGLDGTALFTINLNKSSRLTSGLDYDLILTDGPGNLQFFCIPINLEVDLKRNVVFMMEVDIDTKIGNNAYDIIAAGLQFYF